MYKGVLLPPGGEGVLKNKCVPKFLGTVVSVAESRPSWLLLLVEGIK